MLAQLVLIVCMFQPDPSKGGRISGTVVNGTGGKAMPCQTMVMLRVLVDGQLVPLREEPADAQGRFVFRNLPVGMGHQYSPGANRDGIHYPGPRIRLTPQSPYAAVELTVYDAVQEPSPLVIRRQEIRVRPTEGALHVNESILVENPSTTSYVGRSEQDGANPVTLQLAIPSDFEQITFDEEFFGRRFWLSQGRLITGIPWTPGQREVKFHYVLRNTERRRTWQRPLDLPCSDLRLCVCDSEGKVACSLGPPTAEQGGELVFESRGKTLPAGHLVRLELGQLPLSWIVYARWSAPVVLIGLMAASWVALKRRQTVFRKGDGQGGESLVLLPAGKGGQYRGRRGKPRAA